LSDRGDIKPTGRELSVPGVDGFTIGADDRIYAACWGKGHIAIADIESMKIVGYIDVPARIPASCAFVGDDMSKLAVVTATYGIPEAEWESDGMVFLHSSDTRGRPPYLFGGK
jgi:sugar lactone lactonase YvrE